MNKLMQKFGMKLVTAKVARRITEKAKEKQLLNQLNIAYRRIYFASKDGKNFLELEHSFWSINSPYWVRAVEELRSKGYSVTYVEYEKVFPYTLVEW